MSSGASSPSPSMTTSDIGRQVWLDERQRDGNRPLVADITAQRQHLDATEGTPAFCGPPSRRSDGGPIVHEQNVGDRGQRPPTPGRDPGEADQLRPNRCRSVSGRATRSGLPHAQSSSSPFQGRCRRRIVPRSTRRGRRLRDVNTAIIVDEFLSGDTVEVDS